MIKKIGIFAGTFDPIHNGHITFAEAALNQGLEKVMFLVEPRPRRKQGVRALEHRIAMVQLAISKQPLMGTIILEQSQFTVHDTLPVLQQRFKGYQLVLMFGDDVITHIANWPHVDSLVKSTELLIATRHKASKDLNSAMNTLQQTRNFKIRYNTLFLDEQVASSVIRLKMKRGELINGIPDVVQRYIKEHRLYSSLEGK